MGVRDSQSPKVQQLLKTAPEIISASITDAVSQSDVVLISTPSNAVFDIISQLGDVTGKVIIDATNTMRGKPAPYESVYQALTDKTNADVVKCFKSTGFVNLQNPVYGSEGIDMFMAGDSPKAKEVAVQLAKDAGFGSCLDFGTGDKVALLEQIAVIWVNLCMAQGEWNLAFKVLKR
ncbi:NAD(P)-binding domain-containing protein [Runella sp.]|uniref:NADPH-dependent F420 reductase n=1 Tax=Runella sp. TaxID=1960881 RepID=UPI0030172F2A